MQVAKYLAQLRQSKSIGANAALQHLGQGWSAQDESTLEKQFVFDDYRQANNFMLRYTEYCQKLN